MRYDGVPVPMFTCSPYDLDRKPRLTAKDFRALGREFGQISILPHGEMFDITGRPARLGAA